MRTKDGQPGLLSAGHCNKPGGPGKVAVHHGGLNKYPVVGTFTESVYDGNDWNDFGLITVDHPSKIPLTAEVDGHPVTELAEHAEIGDTLCYFGIRNGGAMCGPVLASEANKVRFTTTGTCGDSGGPVYRIQPDGTAEAVGIFIAVSNGDYSEPTCDGPHQYSVGQSIKPWLAAATTSATSACETAASRRRARSHRSRQALQHPNPPIPRPRAPRWLDSR